MSVAKRGEAQTLKTSDPGAAVVTALVPRIGYARVSKLARQPVAQGRPLTAILDESGLLSRSDALSEIDRASYPVFDPR